ncbi:hypothetical protein [uncultured Duncaniella sp.]|uniref:hypothetical protein n=1 Tax=uncultured Duncaniella sp. TaxID=2768039 RepID=UPI0025B713C2|nr:hypothetical protein [uncultured Duncaniella sp.]
MKNFLRAVIASSLFLGTATGMSAISTTQIMLNLRPIVIIPGYEEEGNTGERLPGNNPDCTIDPHRGVQFQSGETPDFILFASGSKITGKTKSYFLREGEIFSENDNACFEVMQDGIVNITSTRSLATDKAFEIKKEGAVDLRSFGDILLCKDVVKNGGKLNVTGEEVCLNSGFTVEKGGELVISTNK